MSHSIPRRQFLTLTALGAGFIPLTPLLAEIQRKRVRANCAARGHYQYGHDGDQIQERLVSKKGIEDQVVLNLEYLRMQHTPADGLLPGEGIALPAQNSVFGANRILDRTRDVNGLRRATLPSIQMTTDSAAVPQLVRRKTFIPEELQLDVEFVRLDQVALALYETGHINCTGRIAHNGGLNQELKGAKVTIRVRIYSEANSPNFAPLNGPVLATWEQTRWVSFKSSPEEIDLVNLDCDRNIRLKYDEISHMSVNLVYWRSR